MPTDPAMGPRLWAALALLILFGPTASPDPRGLPRIWDPDADDPISDDPISNDPISDIATPLFLSSRGFAPPHGSADPIEATSDPIDADSPSPHKRGSFPILKDDNGVEELKVEFLPVDLGSKGKKRGKRSAGPVRVDPIDPISVKVGPTDPIRVGVDPTGPTGVKVDPLANVDPIGVGVDPTDPITVGADPIDPVRIRVDPTDPIRTKTDLLANIDPIRGRADPIDPIDPIRTRADPLANVGPIGVGVDPTDPIRVGADPIDPIKAGADPTDPIRAAAEPVDPIRTRADPLTNVDPIGVGVDPTDPIRIGADPIDPTEVNPLTKLYPIVTVERFGVAELLGDPNLSGDISGSGDTELPTTTTDPTTTPKPPQNPTTTPHPISTPQQGLCHNNGVYINGICHCTPLFYGVECQYAKESVEVTNATVSASVTMSVQVVNRAFSPALENPKSPEFTQFRLEFQQKMKELYGNVEGYEGVEILSLREGSVVVTYDVLLRVGAGIGAPAVVEDIVEDLLVATVANCDQCAEVTCEQCFNASHTSVTNYTIQPLDAALCSALVPPPLIGSYSPIPAPTGALCVSRCHPQSDRPFPCVHGACAVSSDGPQCDCSDPASFWYLDSSCGSRLSKVGVALGLPLAVICVIAAGCGAALLKARRQRRADREKLRSHTALYDTNEEEEEIWGGGSGFAASNRAASWGELEAPNGTYISLRSVGGGEVRIQRPQLVAPP